MSFIEELLPRAYAVSAVTPVGTADPNSTANAAGLLSSLGDKVVDILFLIGGILAVIYLLWAGVQYITAGGNADKAKAARQAIINAVIGIIIMMAAFAIIRFATAIGTWASKSTGSTGTPSSGSSTTRSTGTGVGGAVGGGAVGGLGGDGASGGGDEVTGNNSDGSDAAQDDVDNGPGIGGGGNDPI